MGKKSSELKKIEDNFARKIALEQRKQRLIKRAIELSVLCEQEIHLVILDKKTNNISEFNSSKDFDESAVTWAKNSRKGVHQKYSCEDLDELNKSETKKSDFKEQKKCNLFEAQKSKKCGKR